MSNPATELAQILESWSIAEGSNTANTRELAGGTVEGWRKTGHAASLLVAIDVELDAMAASGDDVSDYRAYMTQWYEGVFSFQNGWQQGKQTATPALPEAPMRMLKVLGLMISKFGRSSLGSPTQRGASLACIREAIAMLETDLEDWDKSEKEYLYRLLAAARRAIEERGVVGETDLRALMNELIGGMTAVALDLRASEGQSSNRFTRVMDWVGRTIGVSRGILYDTEAATSLTASVVDIAKQITQG